MQLLQNPITVITITITIFLSIITCTVYDSANGARLINLCNITADGMAFASEVKHFFLNVHDICRANLLAHVTWNAMATSCVTYWDGLFAIFLCYQVFLYANSFANIPLLVLVVGKFIREQNRIMVSLKSFLVVVALQCFTFSVVNPEFTTQF